MGLPRSPFPHRSNLKAIVITTINKPTEAILKFVELAEDEWIIIIVGDHKTPHRPYQALHADGHLIYLHPDMQSKLYPELSKAIGWNTSIRRNIGYVYAYHLGSKIVATVDDDNIPYDNWGKDLLVNKPTLVDVYSTGGRVNDPLFVVGDGHLWHRGFPLELVRDRELEYYGKKVIVPQVQVSFWDGDPDIDAIERIIMPSTYFKCKDIPPFTLDGIAPFNSQNTFFSRQAIAYYLLLPGVGRVDDIWGSYLLQQEFTKAIVYTPPTVFQERNDHDLFKDLADEMFGYTNVLAYITGKVPLPQKAKELYQIYRRTMEINGPVN